MNLPELSLVEAATGLQRGDWRSVDLVKESLRLATDNVHNAYVTVLSERAMREADESDQRRAAGNALSPFDGVPMAVKDLIMLAGEKTTAGSRLLSDYVASYDATVVRRLKSAGVVIVGKTNLDEFAMGSSSETSFFGPTLNPWDRTRIPGGSSGGSAAAVAEGSVLAALGTDTGGSIRQPAAMCGVVGLKPTYGRVSRFGSIAMASSLDQIGPMARSARDVAALQGLIEGLDAQDATSVAIDAKHSLPQEWSTSLAGVRFGLPSELWREGADADVVKSVMAAVETLRGLGAEIQEVELTQARRALAAYYVIMPCEVSANLARHDGIRYGQRVVSANLTETYEKSRGAGFGAEVRRRIMLGTYALSAGYYDAYYLRALKVRRLIVEDFRRALAGVDALLTPTSPVSAWKLGEKLDDPLQMYLADVFTVPVSVAGLPGVSVPCGKANGLPIGLQMIGRPFEDGRLLSFAHAYEQARGPFGRPDNG